MNYWITTHYPPRKEKSTKNPYAIYLPDDKDRYKAGQDIAPGDIVLIYETKFGKPIVKYDVNGIKYNLYTVVGKKGIIAVAEVTTSLLEDPEEKPTKYADGKVVLWKWYADTKLISKNGFVQKEDVNRLLGYKLNNPMKGFGDRKSGLKKITKEQYEKFIEIYRSNTEGDTEIKQLLKEQAKKAFSRDSVGESPAHKNLKEYIASNPSQILDEYGLKKIRTEYPFPTHDRADIVLRDAMGKFIGLEVELNVSDSNLDGVLQAIKYRYMLAVMEGVDFLETRAFLVAHSITKNVLGLCRQYDVECFIVGEKDVDAWLKK